MTSPSPAQMPGSRPVPGADVSGADAVEPAEVTAQIREITDQIDAIVGDRSQDLDDDADGTDIAALEATADLVDRAHGVLTSALDRLDRV
ncbi:hypothetical protein [Williamsia deligens]|uniref:Uncharacterized protein n=1 Tax=Williamsia deligens TaxID=321325 RepID=A0ABW3GA69_9NOCA|nr:hypothetical protein [Williamsia deligens]MCP2196137.1 hypothetical protein [Williamsia deligens]